MMRALRYVAALFCFSVRHASMVVLAAVAGVRQRRDGVYDRAAREWARGILRWCRVRVTIEGRERLDPDVAVVYIANHASFLDILALLAELPGTVRFVYKKGMTWIPLLGTAMRAARHIPIDRRNRSASFAAYDEAAEFIREGASAVVFAEGTRSRDGRLHPFKKGPFVLAIAAQAAVVPVFCFNSFELLPKGSWSPKPGAVTLRIGAAIPTVGMQYEARDRIAARAREAIVGMGAVEQGVAKSE